MRFCSRFLNKCLLAALLAGAAGWPLRADDGPKVLTTFKVRLSERDHVNAKGNRLTTPAAILRRDRERFYAADSKDHPDLEDERDSYFGDVDHRNLLEHALEKGHTTPTTYGAMLTGTPLVEVTVYGTADGNASYVDVKFIRGGKPVVQE